METLWRKSLNFTYTKEIILQRNMFQKYNNYAYLEKTILLFVFCTENKSVADYI